MNNITITQPAPPARVLKKGDLFRQYNTATIYVLHCSCNRWTTVSITDGNYWSASNDTAEAATAGLEFLGRDASIAITFPKSG